MNPVIWIDSRLGQRSFLTYSRIIAKNDRNNIGKKNLLKRFPKRCLE